MFSFKTHENTKLHDHFCHTHQNKSLKLYDRILWLLYYDREMKIHNI